MKNLLNDANPFVHKMVEKIDKGPLRISSDRLSELWQVLEVLRTILLASPLHKQFQITLAS